MKTNWVMRKKCTILTAYSGHLNTDFYPVFSLRIHISVQIPHQDGMLPLISTMPLHNLHFLLSESIYRHQHVCSNLVTTRDLRGISGKGRVPCWFAQPSPVQWPLGIWLSALCFSCFLVLKICMVSGFPPQQATKHRQLGQWSEQEKTRSVEWNRQVDRPYSTPYTTEQK